MHVSTCKGCQVKHGCSAICTEAYPLEKSKVRQNATYKIRTCLLRAKLSCFRNSAIFCDVTGFLVLLRRSSYYSGRASRDLRAIMFLKSAGFRTRLHIKRAQSRVYYYQPRVHVNLCTSCYRVRVPEISNVRLFERLNARA